jgi:hypothetical protein
MEEEGGFEPPRGLTRLSVFKTDPFSRTWVFLQMKYKAKNIGGGRGDRTPDLTGMNRTL